MEDLFYCVHNAVRSAQLAMHEENDDAVGIVPEGFDPIANGGVIHERRHALTWALSPGVDWDEVAEWLQRSWRSVAPKRLTRLMDVADAF